MKCPHCGGTGPAAAFQREEPGAGLLSEPLKIFVGWDSKEPLAFSVLAHSILSRATRPVSIVPLTRQSLKREYTRPRGPTEATEFSLTRFLVPYLSGYKGISVFLDCDMLCRVDIGDVLLHVLMDPGKAVYCCQHDYVPKALTKFLGQEQTTYPCKNWSSHMIFDNAKCTALSLEYVNTASGLELHRMHWADGQVGSLPLGWNWLVGEYEPNPQAQIYHYTNGLPAYKDYANCDHSEEWWREYEAMLAPAKAVETALRLAEVA